MAIRMRRGNEADFDPSKMLPGEWAVSTDTKYVRMCFSPGIVLRMATYEAFESDMAEMRKILSECQSIQTAVELIQKNVTNSELVIENYVKEAKQYRDEAEQFRNEASMFAPEGYEDLVKNVSNNTVKIDTIIEKAELNIKNNAKGSNIHLTDSADSNVVALELYGKTEQNAYTGKNLLDCSGLTETTTNGVTFTPVYDENGNLLYVNANGTDTKNAIFELRTEPIDKTDAYILNGCPSGGSITSYRISYTEWDASWNWLTASIDTGNGILLTHKDNVGNASFKIEIYGGTVCNNLKFYPMVRLADVSDETYEPYVGGKPSPSPDYPQEIKSIKGKNLLDCRGLTEQEVNGGKFTPVYDDNGNLLYINVNGTFSARSVYRVNSNFYLNKDNYIATGNSANCNCVLDLYNNDTYVRSYGIKAEPNIKLVDYEYTKLQYYIVVESGTTVSNEKIYPMIRLASIKDNTYVPYGLLRIKTHGKNLLDCSGLTETTTNGVTFTPVYENGKLQYINANGASTNAYFNLGTVIYPNECVLNGCPTGHSTSSAMLFAQTTDGSKAYFDVGNGITIPANTELNIFARIASGYTANNLKFYPMISEEGGEYQPHQTTEVTLSEPIELNGFNGVYDVVTSDGVTRRFGVAVLDGSENYRMYGKHIACNVIDTLGKPGYSNYTIPAILCDRFIPDTPSNVMNGVNSDIVSVAIVNDTYRLRFYSDIFTSVEDAVNYFTENPTTVVYELATPTTEKLKTDFTALKTFYPETHVSNDADCDMSITYTADAKNYIDNKIALLTTAIYNNI